MARRRSSIARRIASLRGISTAEKRLLERVGTLVDAQINNRGPANPFAEGRRRANKKLPPPKVITSDPGIKTSKLSWEAVNSSILSHYEIVIINMDDGTDETIKTFTNVYFYKGRAGGNYKATVCSVGRDGTKSPIVAEKFFSIPDNIMLIEGSKNSYQTEGDEVAEDLQFLTNHKIFAFAAFTIDHLIGESGSDNPVPSVQLRLATGEAQTFANSTLIEEIPLFAATESATSLDNTTLGGISRPAVQPPASSDLNFTRGTTFETSFSVMFSAIEVNEYVDAGIVTENSTNTLFLKVIGREDENDIISLSLTLWSVPAGQSSQIPAITLSTEPELTYPWFTSVSLNADRAEGTSGAPTNPTALTWYHSPALQGLGENIGRKRIGRQWTFGIWIKFERLIFASSNTGAYFFERFESLPNADFPTSFGFGYNRNHGSVTYTPLNGFGINIGRQEPAAGNTLFALLLGGKERALLDGSSERVQTYIWQDSYSNIDNDEYSQPVYTAADPNEPIITTLNTWHLILLSYNDVDGPTLWVDGVRKRDGTLSGDVINPVFEKGRGHLAHTVGSRGSIGLYREDAPYLGSWTGLQNSSAGVNGTNNGCPCLIYAVGLWNVSTPIFTDAVAVELSNQPTVNWREPIIGGAYRMNGNLAHYWQMSATLEDYPDWVARDTGWYIPPSGGFTGRANASTEGYHGTEANMPQSTIVVLDAP